MKKKSTTLLATLTLVASLTACGSQTEAPATTTPNASVQESVAESQSQPTTAPTEAPVPESPEAPTSAEDELQARIAAANAMIDTISADSDYHKMELFEHLLMYCCLTNLEGYPQETALLEVQSSRDSDSAKAFADLIDAHSSEIQEGFIAEEPLWYCEDFDSLYAEYQSNLQGAIAVVDTIEKAFVNLKVTDNVLFNENGVTFTFDSCDDGKMYFTLDNNNDSNKKVFIDFGSIYVNGVEFVGGVNPYFSVFTEDGVQVYGDIENGMRVQLVLSIDSNMESYDNFYTNLGTTYLDSPFETIQFDYSIKIGSNAEAIYKSVVMHTPSYNNNSLYTLFGEHFTTLEVTKEYTTELVTVDTYGKFADANCVFYLKGLTPGYSTGETRINDLLINGVKLSNNTDYTMYNLSDGILFIVNRSEDELRKQCEIGNDEPLNVNLEMNFVQYTIFTK